MRKARKDHAGSVLPLQICFLLGCVLYQTFTWLFKPRISHCLLCCDLLSDIFLRLPLQQQKDASSPLQQAAAHAISCWAPRTFKMPFSLSHSFSSVGRGLQEMREVKRCDFTEGPRDLVHLAFRCFSFFVEDPYLLFQAMSSV